MAVVDLGVDVGLDKLLGGDGEYEMSARQFMEMALFSILVR